MGIRAELLIDGSTVVNLVSAYDTGDGISGAAGAPNGPPNGYLNGYTGTAGGEFPTALLEYDNRRVRDEFNPGAAGGIQFIENGFPLRNIIPAAANSVQLRIYGAGTDATESFALSEVLFTTSGPATDTDADGSTDWQELAMGTNPGDPWSVFRITGILADPAKPGTVTATFPTVIGRLYWGYYSNDLRNWFRDETEKSRNGTGGEASWPFVPGDQRRFMKVEVRGTHGDFPQELHE